jgi:hypothetical protein
MVNADHAFCESANDLLSEKMQVLQKHACFGLSHLKVEVTAASSESPDHQSTMNLIVEYM